MWIVAWGLAVLLVAGSVALVWALARLPFAPACPRCGGVTLPARERPLLARLGGLAPLRHCGGCGWDGRMRWRVAAAAASHRA